MTSESHSTNKQTGSRQNTRIVVAGVPEHFNLPWHLAIESRSFEPYGLEVEFIEFPEGTGAMTQALREKKVDLALLLTEGCVADLLSGNPSRIVKVYVESPLIWGIHVAASSDIKTTDQIRGRRYAISRFGSGSHLMGIVDAVERGWSADEAKLVQTGDLEGARKSLEDAEADVFFWEKYTTNPFVTSGEFRRVGIRKTLWPAFVVCAHLESLHRKAKEIRQVLEIINLTCENFMQDENATRLIAQRYGLSPEMVKEWFSLTSWNCGFTEPRQALQTAREYLEKIEIINAPEMLTEELWFQL